MRLFHMLLGRMQGGSGSEKIGPPAEGGGVGMGGIEVGSGLQLDGTEGDIAVHSVEPRCTSTCTTKFTASFTASFTAPSIQHSSKKHATGGLDATAERSSECRLRYAANRSKESDSGSQKQRVNRTWFNRREFNRSGRGEHGRRSECMVPRRATRKGARRAWKRLMRCEHGGGVDKGEAGVGCVPKPGFGERNEASPTLRTGEKRAIVGLDGVERSSMSQLGEHAANRSSANVSMSNLKWSNRRGFNRTWLNRWTWLNQALHARMETRRGNHRYRNLEGRVMLGMDHGAARGLEAGEARGELRQEGRWCNHWWFNQWWFNHRHHFGSISDHSRPISDVTATITDRRHHFRPTSDIISTISDHRHHFRPTPDAAVTRRRGARAGRAHVRVVRRSEHHAGSLLTGEVGHFPVLATGCSLQPKIWHGVATTGVAGRSAASLLRDGPRTRVCEASAPVDHHHREREGAHYLGGREGVGNFRPATGVAGGLRVGGLLGQVAESQSHQTDRHRGMERRVNLGTIRQVAHVHARKQEAPSEVPEDSRCGQRGLSIWWFNQRWFNQRWWFNRCWYGVRTLWCTGTGETSVPVTFERLRAVRVNDCDARATHRCVHRSRSLAQLLAVQKLRVHSSRPVRAP